MEANSEDYNTNKCYTNTKEINSVQTETFDKTKWKALV